MSSKLLIGMGVLGVSLMIVFGITRNKKIESPTTELKSAANIAAQKSDVPVVDAKTTTQVPLKVDDDTQTLRAKANQEENSYKESRTRYFSESLHLEAATLKALTELREQALAKEAELLRKMPETEEENIETLLDIQENRTNYENRLRALIGNENWVDFMEFYRQSWGLEPRSEIDGALSLALK